MSIWSKVVTALRGGINEAGEAIADSQALRILDQEIRDAEEELSIAKQRLVEMMAKQKVAEQQYTALSAEINEYEEYAVKALNKNDDALALELAEKIANLEKKRITEQSVLDDYTENTQILRDTIQQSGADIKHLQHELDSVRATENVQRVQEASAQRQENSNSKLSAAMESLQRIKEKQALNNARFEATQELAKDLTEDSLQQRLESAGIMADDMTGETILAQLKDKVILRIESDQH